jgi:tetratricopeptide (TPR) repeat protein
MMNHLIKIYCPIFLCSLFFVFLAGCGTKEISMEPKIKYGNPSYTHVKDLPQVKYDDLLDKDAEPDRPVEMTTVEMTDDAFERLGDIMLARGEYFLAVTNYERSLKKNRNNIQAEYKKGLAFLAWEKNKEAAVQFQLVIEKQDDFAKAYEGLGRVNFLNKDYYKGINNFKKAIELDPLLWKSYNFLGNIYDVQGKYNPAVKEYKTAITIKPDAGFIYNNLGVSLYLQGNNKEAVKAFDKALELKYSNNRVYNNLGLTLGAMELYDKALESFKKAGSEAEAYNNLGCVYLKRGLKDKAARSFTKAIEISPQFYNLANENLKKCRTVN